MRILFLSLFFLSTSVLTAGNPLVQAKNLKVAERTCNSIRITWNTGDGEYSLVTCRPWWQPRADPEDSQVIFASARYGNGSGIGFGVENYAVFLGTDSAVNVYGLLEDSAYIFQVYTLNAPPFYYLTNASPTDTISTYTMHLELFGTLEKNCLNNNKASFSIASKIPFSPSGYEWTVNDTTLRGDTTFVCHFVHSGYQTTRVKVLPDLRCREQSADRILYIIPGVIHGEITAQNSACIYSDVVLKDSIHFDMVSGASFTRKWYTPSGNTFTTSRIVQKFASPGDYVFREIIYTRLNNEATHCSDTFSSVITVHGLPVFALSTDSCLKKGDSLTLQGPVNMQNYLWSDSSTSFNYILRHSDSIWLQVTDSFGCIYKDTISVDTCWVAPDLKTKPDQIIQKYTVYPNPVSNYLYIQTSLTFFSWRLVNMLGNTVESGQNQREINIANLAQGIYYLVLKTNVLEEAHKVQIIH